MEATKFWLLMLGGRLLVAVRVANSIFVNQLNATQFQLQFQLELSLAQLSPSLLNLFVLSFFELSVSSLIMMKKVVE